MSRLWNRIRAGKEPVLVAAAVELVILAAAAFGFDLPVETVLGLLALIGVQTAGVRAKVKPDKWSLPADDPQ